MNHNDTFEAALGYSVMTWLVGIPVAFGYLLRTLSYDPQYAIGVIFGSIAWPLVVLGKIGVWLAS